MNPSNGGTGRTNSGEKLFKSFETFVIQKKISPMFKMEKEGKVLASFYYETL